MAEKSARIKASDIINNPVLPQSLDGVRRMIKSGLANAVWY
jgi:hypothetical protein